MYRLSQSQHVMNHHRETLCVWRAGTYKHCMYFQCIPGPRVPEHQGILFKFGAADLTNSYANGVCAPNSCVNGVAAFITNS